MHCCLVTLGTISNIITWHHISFQVTKMFVVCPSPAENDTRHGGMLASAKVTYVKGLEPSLPAGCGVEPTDTQLRRDCLADIIMKVLEKPLSVEETHAILDKARTGSAARARHPRSRSHGPGVRRRMPTRLVLGGAKDNHERVPRRV